MAQADGETWDLVCPDCRDDLAGGYRDQLEEVIVKIAEYIEETIALEETLALEDDCGRFMEAQIRKQHLQECIEAISDYVEEITALEDEQQGVRVEDCRKEDTRLLVEAIARVVEDLIAMEEEELREAVEEYVLDLRKAFEESKHELTNVRSGVRFLETWYLRKAPVECHTTSFTVSSVDAAATGLLRAVTEPLFPKAGSSCKWDCEDEWVVHLRRTNSTTSCSPWKSF